MTSKGLLADVEKGEHKGVISFPGFPAGSIAL